MGYTFSHGKVTREFLLYAPIGWQHWLAMALENGRSGLPVVVALHGGGEDPLTFAAAWPFPFAWLLPAEDGSARDWENQFFVIYPFGTSTFDVADGPLRTWNTGLNGSSVAPVNEVSFIEELLARANLILLDDQVADLLGHKSLVSMFDVDRMFLFGYSEGGMLAYQLVNEMPDVWAALWVMSGAIGGTSHFGYTDEFPVVEYPPTGTKKISLFHHHGGSDTIVPPDLNPNVSSEVCRSISAVVALVDPGNLPPPISLPGGGLVLEDAHSLAQAFLPLDDAIGAYRDYNGLSAVGELTLFQPSVVVDQGPASQFLPPVFEPFKGRHSKRTIYPEGELNTHNPQVVVYRDPDMEHTGFTTNPNRYFDQDDVWEFFKAHPRPKIPRTGTS